MSVILRSLVVVMLVGICASCGSPPQPNDPSAALPLPSLPHHILIAPQMVDQSSCRPVDPGNSSEVRRGRQITLEVLIDANGRVTDVALVKSSGSDELDQSLINIVRACSYWPATLDGRPIPLVNEILYSFNSPPSPLSSIRFPAAGRPLTPIHAEVAPPPASGIARASNASPVMPPTLPTGSYDCYPAYPSLSRDLGEQGTVVLLFVVEADGTVMGTQIINSSGHVRLDSAAAMAFQNCRYNPGTINAKPAPMLKMVRWSFAISPDP